MTYGFGSIISRAFKFANTAFPKFTSWFWIVLLTFLTLFGVVIAYTGALIVDLFTMVNTFLSPVVAGTGIEELLTAFGYNSTVPIILGAVILLFGLLISIFFSFFIMGFFVRACKGKDMTLAHPWKMFGQGFLSLVLSIVYFIPVSVITILLYVLGPLSNSVYFVICGIIVPIILSIITTFMYITALVRYAKTGKFGSAFQLGTILKIISSAGWLRYLGFMVLFGLIIFGVSIVFMIVPIVGSVMFLFALPFIIVIEGGFYSELYDCGNKYINVKIK